MLHTTLQFRYTYVTNNCVFAEYSPDDSHNDWCSVLCYQFEEINAMRKFYTIAAVFFLFLFFLRDHALPELNNGNCKY